MKKSGNDDMTLWRIRATVDDRPGFLSVLTASLALRSVNILSVQVHATEADLIEAVERGRGRDAWVCRTDAKGLADEPTRVLALAARVVGDPEALDDALVSLLGECKITWRPAGGPVRAGFNATDLQLNDPGGGMILIHRVEPAFTPAEYARAQALVELAAIGHTRQCRPETAAG